MDLELWSHYEFRFRTSEKGFGKVLQLIPINACQVTKECSCKLEQKGSLFVPIWPFYKAQLVQSRSSGFELAMVPLPAMEVDCDQCRVRKVRQSDAQPPVLTPSASLTHNLAQTMCGKKRAAKKIKTTGGKPSIEHQQQAIDPLSFSTIFNELNAPAQITIPSPPNAPIFDVTPPPNV